MGTCIFCGTTGKMTKEHIFPKWLQLHLGVKKDPLEISFYSEKPETVRTLTYNTHVNRNVCAECNNGWMSRLETEAKPILLSLIDNNISHKFSDEQVHTLGLWIFKTVLTLHDVNPHPKRIPSRHYELAYKRTAPANFFITLARLKEQQKHPSWIQDVNWVGLPQSYYQNNETNEKIKTSYRVVIGFGHFAASIIYLPLDVKWFRYEDGIQFIHPYKKIISWPPSYNLDTLWDLNNALLVSLQFSPDMPSEKPSEY